MIGECALFKTKSELRESHIYPKFVIDYTKKTGSRFLRKTVNPNKREQDGIKLHLLSHTAEQEFGKREKWFAENIFVPYLTEQKYTLPYDENMYYFAVSFLWRVLVLNLKTDLNINKYWYYNLLIKAEKEWREYLANDRIPEKFSNINLMFTDRVLTNNSELKGVDFYTTRVMDATIVDNKPHTCLLIYGKFNKFIFWGVLKDYGGEELLTDTRINPSRGVFRIPQKFEYFPIVSFLGNRIKEVNSFPLPNQSQQEKIEKEILKDPIAFWNSDVGKSLFNDKFNLDK
jgi:hypothetical protein